MEQLPNGGAVSPHPDTSLMGKDHKTYRAFAVFLICCAMGIALFSVYAICRRAEQWQSPQDGADPPLSDLTGSTATGQTSAETTVPPTVSEIPKSELPEGAVEILSFCFSGNAELLNETPYRPDLSALLQESFAERQIGEDPLVLILHTHPSEAYLTSEQTYFSEPIGDATYSDDRERNLLKVGAVFCRVLNQNGIPTIHCQTLHDDSGLSGSYDRAAESIQWYLEQYPSIRYVIDLHRDAVMTDQGAYVRSVADGTSEPTAQIMAVVGSDCNGTAVPNQERNLALAVRLWQKLNGNGQTVCRTPYLKRSSYNQEYAPCSLLLEIGTGANTVEEACRAAELAAEALSQIFHGE